MEVKEVKSIEEVGIIPKNEPLFRKMARQQQTWWRINVLKEPCDVVCSKISDPEETGKNFLTDNIRKAVKDTLDARQKALKERNVVSGGMIERKRLYNNLLSSQPLCFNFFGELHQDTAFGLKVLQCWLPQLTELEEVVFEFAPDNHFDNSAFDVAFIVKAGEKRGLIGLEVKYTDSFSRVIYNKQEYSNLYKNSAFKNSAEVYNDLITAKYNQLFRNQLIAESLKQNPDSGFDFAYSGLFCYPYDNHALAVAARFKAYFKNPEEFKVITYTDFVSKVMTLTVKPEIKSWCGGVVERYCKVVYLAK